MTDDPAVDGPVPGGPVHDQTFEHDPVDDSTEDRFEYPSVAGRGHRARDRRARWTREWVVLVVLTVLGTFVIRTYVVQTYRIPSQSMENTLHGCTPHCNNDRVLVDKLSYKLHGIHRGDIVVFKAPVGQWRDALGPEDVIKRVIGLPGDTVQCCDAQDRLIVNGFSQNEPYLSSPNKPAGPQGNESPFTFHVVVPKGQLWVEGDNRAESEDSRFNGPITQSSVVGHAFLRIWPIPRIHTLH